MTAIEKRTHVVYLLKRKSDSLLYVGITIKDRLSNRLSQHRCSERYENDDFTYKILEESYDRSYIEKREAYYIDFYDSFENGLNNTLHGKGHGHDSPNFTTLGYVYSDKSRKKMSESAKKRCESKEWKEMASSISTNLWKDPVYREKQKGKRKGKRLRPPVLSDDTVEKIRLKWKNEIDYWESLSKNYIRPRGSRGKSAMSLFIDHIQPEYNVSHTLLGGILRNTCRTQSLPHLYKS